ncbi:MAG: deoxyribose-phosphate aldolase [Ignavibacteria bacterium]
MNITKLIKKHSTRVDEKLIWERINYLLSKELEFDRHLIRKIVSFIDLTSLEGKDTPASILSLCKRAIQPFSNPNETIHCAAVCVYPLLVPSVKKFLQDTKVRLAAVSTGFPSGQFPLKTKIEETRYCIFEGAEEIDMVISRGSFLSGKYQDVYDEIKEIKKVCEETSKKISDPSKNEKKIHLKVILETGELESLDNVRKASYLAMYAGADFIKTSTGKSQPAATLPAYLVMLDAINDYYLETNTKVGIKPAGGIRTTDEAVRFLTLTYNVLGTGWINSEFFRIGASSLLDDLIKTYKEFKF